MKGEVEILRANIDACRQRIEKLAYSLDKNCALFPLTRDAVSCLAGILAADGEMKSRRWRDGGNRGFSLFAFAQSKKQLIGSKVSP